MQHKFKVGQTVLRNNHPVYITQLGGCLFIPTYEIMPLGLPNYFYPCRLYDVKESELEEIP